MFLHLVVWVNLLIVCVLLILVLLWTSMIGGVLVRVEFNVFFSTVSSCVWPMNSFVGMVFFNFV